jgi:hypothetical protein
MLQALPKSITKPIGKHSQVSGYLALTLGIEIERLQLPYFVPKGCVVKVGELGYEPDGIVLNQPTSDFYSGRAAGWKKRTGWNGNTSRGTAGSSPSARRCPQTLASCDPSRPTG